MSVLDLNVHGRTQPNGLFSDNAGLLSVWANRQGALVTVPWMQMLALDGRVYAVNYGSATTPIALETAYDADQPDMNIDVPDGTVVLPLFFELAVEATGAAGSSTALTPVNMRLDAPRTTNCSARRTYTGNGTDPSSGSIDLIHGSINQDLDATGIRPIFRWSALESGMAPVICDGGSINMYAYCGTSGTAFGVLYYAELPENWVL